MLARVALSRRQRSVDLLPAGRATAQVAATVALPKRGAGQPIRLGFGLRLRRIAEEAERGDYAGRVLERVAALRDARQRVVVDQHVGRRAGTSPRSAGLCHSA